MLFLRDPRPVRKAISDKRPMLKARRRHQFVDRFKSRDQHVIGDETHASDWVVNIRRVDRSWNVFQWTKREPSAFRFALIMGRSGQDHFMPALGQRPPHPHQRKNVPSHPDTDH